MSWIDITAQQVLSAKILIKMAERSAEKRMFMIWQKKQNTLLILNWYMWMSKKIYFDRHRDGSLSKVKPLVHTDITAIWFLRTDWMGLLLILNENEFKTYHPIPS